MKGTISEILSELDRIGVRPEYLANPGEINSWSNYEVQDIVGEAQWMIEAIPPYNYGDLEMAKEELLEADNFAKRALLESYIRKVRSWIISQERAGQKIPTY